GRPLPLFDEEPRARRQDLRLGAFHPHPGDGDFAAHQSGNLQCLSRLGGPAVQPEVHELHNTVQLADHARRDAELLDAGCLRRVQTGARQAHVWHWRARAGRSAQLETTGRRSALAVAPATRLALTLAAPTARPPRSNVRLISATSLRVARSS